nr:glycosyltransferase [Palleronia pontilimi]
MHKSIFSSVRTLPSGGIDPRGRKLGAILVDAGQLTDERLDWAIRRQRRHLCKIGDILLRHGLVSEHVLYSALARQYDALFLQAADAIAAPDLIDRIGVDLCVTHGILPLRRAGGLCLVATCEPQAFEGLRTLLEPLLGPVAMVVMPRSDLRAKLQAMRRHRLVGQAECRVPLATSCRTFGTGRGGAVALALLALVAAFAWAAPVTIFAIAAALACALTVTNTALLLYAMHVPRSRSVEANATDTLSMARLPRVSVLVPLYREREIADALVERLSRLNYPRELLEICLVVEDDDVITRDALDRSDLPLWMNQIAVPYGTLRTKPRAMNYALGFCSGDIIGIYDAEDAPPADQILRVVHQFARSHQDVGCLQGRLNFYNPRASWLTRCFSIDYAAWFFLILPAMHRLGWPIPLGGTTVFFRRAALEDVGGWDAHNVTEDADLGIRLARRGYRTDLLPSLTLEEATIHPRAWVHQRSRWQKGYAITYLVHMRRPFQLLRELGLWRFAGVQILFLGSLGSTVLAPVLWSFWLLCFGLPHPLSGVLGIAPSIILMAILFSSALVGAAAQAQALMRLRRPGLIPALPLMHLYYPLATVALMKALWELIRRPFFWDKTQHGVSQPDVPITELDPAPNRA